MRKITDKTRRKQQETRRLNTLKRYAIIKELVAEKYEEGNQSKCKRQAYRQHIDNLYPMSERTFYRVMGTNIAKENKQIEIDFNMQKS